MKTKLFTVVMMLTLIFAISGCGPYFKNEAQYDKGEWGGVADETTVARIKSDQLAFEKLKETPAQTKTENGVAQGYEGLIANLSSYNRYNFRLIGPETKSYLLGPGEQTNDYLIPGRYTCVVSRGSYEVGSWAFRVSAQQSTFMNKKYHWYVYTDR